MNLTALIANSLWLGSSFPGFLRFRRALHRPQEAQIKLLLRCLSENATTAYGKAHDFDSIRNYQDFAQKVPLVDYDDLEPWISRIKTGETAVLTQDRVTHLIPTSGSTGGRKLIPFTQTLQQEFNQAIGPWISDLYFKCPTIGLGSSYWSVTPLASSLETESPVVPIGFEDDSSYLGGSRKRLVNALMAVPPELRLVDDIAAFRYVTLLCLIRQPDLRLISVWHPSFLTLLLDSLKTNWIDLVNDVRKGSCKYASKIPAPIIASLTPCPKRARQLKDANPNHPRSIWPHLQVISCWGDGHASGPANDLGQRFPGVSVQPKGLLATEAFVTFPFRGFCPLAICSHFFEFIDDQGRIHLAHELVQDAEYEVVVTTGGGLYRYRLNDRIKVSGFLAATPSFKFLGRNGNCSDRVGEKLSEAFVGRAIQEATVSLPESPRFALLAPEAADNGFRYTLFIEGKVDEGLAHRLDQALKQNPHYLYCRKLGQLQSPGVFEIAGAGFEIFASHEMLRGKRLGDIKPCPLSIQTDWAKRFQSKANEIAPSRASGTDGRLDI
ncbi:MAG: auxin-responsive promoter [Pedosphaera sp.]|nr:auxin-responsive promoter [Pedosphaera sp.]